MKARSVFWSILASTLLLLVPSEGRSHDLRPTRFLYLSIAPDSIDALVDYLLPAGPLSDRMDVAIDLDRNGRIEGPFEQLAQAQLLGTRARNGLVVAAQHRQLTWTADASDFSPRGGRGGWRARIAYHLDGTNSANSSSNRECLPVLLSVAAESETTLVRAQFDPEIRIVEGSRPDPSRAIRLNPGDSLRWCIRGLANP